jgi:hypothetical protein
MLRKNALIVAAVMTATCALTACGGPSEDEMEARIARLEAQRDALKSQLNAYDAFEAAERDDSTLVVAGLAANDMERAIKNAMPLRFDASRLHPYVGGDVKVKAIKNVRVSGGAVSFDLHAVALKPKLKVSVPGGYKKMAKELMTGLASGVTISVSGQLYATEAGKGRFFGRTTGARLKRHAKAQYHQMIRQGVDQSLLASPHPIEVPPVDAGGRTLALKGMIPTSKHMALIFRP